MNSEHAKMVPPKDRPQPIEIPTTREGLVLRQFTPADAQEIFDLIDTNREHLSQHGEDTGQKYIFFRFHTAAV